VRNGKWKFIHAGNEANYLFDVTSDEHEKHNLIIGHPEIARDLAAKLSDWTSRLAPPGDPYNCSTMRRNDGINITLV